MTAHTTAQLILHVLVLPRDLLLPSESCLLDGSLERASFRCPRLHGLPLDGDLPDRDSYPCLFNNTCLSKLILSRIRTPFQTREFKGLECPLM